MALSIILFSILVSKCLSVALALTSTSPSPIFREDFATCRSGSTQRINFGKPAEPGEFPYQVLLRHNGKAICGGAILNSRLILTAAHCFYDPNTGTRNDPKDYLVVAGEHDLCLDERNEQVRSVTEILSHENYSFSTSDDNDIGIMVLASPLKMTEFVRGIQYPTPGSSRLKFMTNATVVGWGSNSTRSGIMARTLQKLSVSLLTNKVCQEKRLVPPNYTKITPGMLCADVVNGKDACNGDSGGALICKSASRVKTETLCGIVSWGSYCGIINPGPGVYADVSYYADWIDRISKKILSQGECGRNEFLCSTNVTEGVAAKDKDSKCINMRYFCDGVKNCENNEDEKDCPMTSLPATSPSSSAPFVGNEIRRTWLCKSNEFTCETKNIAGVHVNLCIPSTKVCNGVRDCTSNKDEENCPSVAPNSNVNVVAVTVPSTLIPVTVATNVTRATKPYCVIKCYNGKCIKKKHLCDGIKHCGENEDETFPLCNFQSSNFLGINNTVL